MGVVQYGMEGANSRTSCRLRYVGEVIKNGARSGTDCNITVLNYLETRWTFHDDDDLVSVRKGGDGGKNCGEKRGGPANYLGGTGQQYKIKRKTERALEEWVEAEFQKMGASDRGRQLKGEGGGDLFTAPTPDYRDERRKGREDQEYKIHKEQIIELIIILQKNAGK